MLHDIPSFRGGAFLLDSEQNIGSASKSPCNIRAIFRLLYFIAPSFHCNLKSPNSLDLRMAERYTANKAMVLKLKDCWEQ